jgi:hypothetical protein
VERSSPAAPRFQSLLVCVRGFRLLSVSFGVQLRGFASMMRCMLCVALRGVRVMRSRFMVSSLVMLSGFAVMLRGVVMMLGGLAVMVRSFLGHGKSP